MQNEFNEKMTKTQQTNSISFDFYIQLMCSISTKFVATLLLAVGLTTLLTGAIMGNAPIAIIGGMAAGVGASLLTGGFFSVKKKSNHGRAPKENNEIDAYADPSLMSRI